MCLTGLGKGTGQHQRVVEWASRDGWLRADVQVPVVSIVVH
jgi:hypothetical protein